MGERCELCYRWFFVILLIGSGFCLLKILLVIMSLLSCLLFRKFIKSLGSLNLLLLKFVFLLLGLVEKCLRSELRNGIIILEVILVVGFIL